MGIFTGRDNINREQKMIVDDFLELDDMLMLP